MKPESVEKIYHDKVLYCSTCMGGSVIELVLLKIDELPKAARRRLEELKKTQPDVLTIIGVCPVCQKYTAMMAAEV